MADDRGGSGVVTYAVASPSSGHGTEGQAQRPVKVWDLALKSAAGGNRELPRTDTKQFSMPGVAWTGAIKRLHGAAQVRTRDAVTGKWTGWQDLDANLDPLPTPSQFVVGIRGAGAGALPLGAAVRAASAVPWA